MARKKNKKKLKPNLKKFLKSLDSDAKKNLGLIFLGALLILTYGTWRFHQSRILSFNRQFETQVVSGTKPVKISIPKIGINLPVTEAEITDNTWEISWEGASHWNNSANPGSKGNIVIYGHNKNNLFGPIRWLDTGEIIEVTDADGNMHQYEIVETVITDADQVDYVLPTEKEVLTLYTCTGFLDSQRHIVIAKPKLLVP